MIDMSMWIEWNPNPTGRRVGDCAVRAVAKALKLDWETAYLKLCKAGYEMGDMPSSNAVWGSVLRQHGFKRYVIPNSCPDCYTAEAFARDHPRGIYTLVFSNHTATIRDGVIMDSWDSSALIPQSYWAKEK